MTYKINGLEAEDLIKYQINQHANGIQNSLSKFDATQAIKVWLEALRCIEELINLPLFEMEDEQAALDLCSHPINFQHPAEIEYLCKKITPQFDNNVVKRFVRIIIMSTAIGTSFRTNGIECEKDFKTIGSAITYFQSRRRQMVALLYMMPNACIGKEYVSLLDGLNVFLPIVEHSCVGLTTLYRNLVLLKIFDDYELTVGQQSFTGNRSLDLLNEHFLEPERVSITEVSHDKINLSVLQQQGVVNSGQVFSVQGLENELLSIEATYSEFNLGATEFGSVAQFIINCARHTRDQYYIELEVDIFKQYSALCKLSATVQHLLVYTGESYANAINSFSPFIVINRKYITTITLLSRFAYNWKTICLNKIKRFQIRSGFIFEQQVQDALRYQSFDISDIKRINQQEFDVIATKGDVIYNVQCKNNLVDFSSIEHNPKLFERYNRKLDKYYAKALQKEEKRDNLLKQKLKLEKIEHILLSKFPIATKNPRVLAFREINQFSDRFSDNSTIIADRENIDKIG